MSQLHARRARTPRLPGLLLIGFIVLSLVLARPPKVPAGLAQVLPQASEPPRSVYLPLINRNEPPPTATPTSTPTPTPDPNQLRCNPTGGSGGNNAVTASQTVAGLGFAAPTNFMDGVTHCAYSTSTTTRDYWQQKSATLTLPDK